MRRGEVYRYEPVLPPRPGQSTKRLIISADALNDPRSATAVALLVEDDDRGGLLSVAVGDQGWVSAIRIERVLPSRLGDLLYTADAGELEAIGRAMRAAYDL